MNDSLLFRLTTPVPLRSMSLVTSGSISAMLTVTVLTTTMTMSAMVVLLGTLEADLVQDFRVEHGLEDVVLRMEVWLLLYTGQTLAAKIIIGALYKKICQ
jgi:hypothetical protein